MDKMMKYASKIAMLRQLSNKGLINKKEYEYIKLSLQKNKSRKKTG